MAGEGVMLVPPYEPGTVAVATVRGVKGVRVFLTEVNRADDRYSVWRHTLVGVHHYSHPDQVTDIRPLVVLDPDDYGAIRNVVQFSGYLEPGAMVRPLTEALQKGLRSLVKPPRIPEPGLWGVVEASCVHGSARLTWVRKGGDWHPVQPNGLREPDDWDSLIDPVLIREGVSE